MHYLLSNWKQSNWISILPGPVAVHTNQCGSDENFKTKYPPQPFTLLLSCLANIGMSSLSSCVAVMPWLWCIKAVVVVILFVVGLHFTRLYLINNWAGLRLLLWLHTQCYSCSANLFLPLRPLLSSELHSSSFFLQHFINNVNILVTSKHYWT